MLRFPSRDDANRPTKIHAVFVPRLPPGTLLRTRFACITLALARAALRLFFSGPFPRIFLLLAIISILVALVLQHGPYAIWIALFSPVSSTLILVAILLLLSASAGLRRYADHARREMLLAQSCPSCLYNLDGLDEDDFGRLRCPECGSCWFAPSIDPTPRVVVVPALQPMPQPGSRTTTPPATTSSTLSPPSS